MMTTSESGQEAPLEGGVLRLRAHLPSERGSWHGAPPFPKFRTAALPGEWESLDCTCAVSAAHGLVPFPPPAKPSVTSCGTFERVHKTGNGGGGQGE